MIGMAGFRIASRLAGVALGLGLALGAAEAQYHGGYGTRSFGPLSFGYAYGYSAPPRRVSPFLHPAEVADLLQDRGFRRINVIERRGDVFIVEAISPRTGATRLILDAYDGDILERYSAEGAPRESRTAPVTPQGGQAPKAKPLSLAELPMPPRRPVGPTVTVPPAQPRSAEPLSRPSSDWAPINSVPVAPLE